MAEAGSHLRYNKPNDVATSPAPRREQLPALTSLRFFAALHVVLHHFAWAEARKHSENYANPLVAGWFNILDVGFLAVSFFFVLSGFILAYTYLDKAEQGLPPRPFYVARFARIYPAYFVSLIPGARIVWNLAKQFGAPFAALYCGAKLAMVHTWLPSTNQGWNDPTWSLSVEALFYASFPFFAVKIARMPKQKVRGWLLAAFAAIVALGIARQIVESQTGDFDLVRNWFLRFPPARLPEFLFGVLLGKSFMAAPKEERIDDGKLVYALATSVAVLACSSLIPGAFLTPVLVPAIAWLLVEAARAKGALGKFLALPWMLLLGEASYSLYLIHGPVRAGYESAMRRLYHGSPDSLAFLLPYVAVAIGASILMHKWVEVPARGWIRSKLDRVPRASQAS